MRDERAYTFMLVGVSLVLMVVSARLIWETAHPQSSRGAVPAFTLIQTALPQSWPAVDHTCTVVYGWNEVNADGEVALQESPYDVTSLNPAGDVLSWQSETGNCYASEVGTRAPTHRAYLRARDVELPHACGAVVSAGSAGMQFQCRDGRVEIAAVVPARQP